MVLPVCVGRGGARIDAGYCALARRRDVLSSCGLQTAVTSDTPDHSRAYAQTHPYRSCGAPSKSRMHPRMLPTRPTPRGCPGASSAASWRPLRSRQSVLKRPTRASCPTSSTQPFPGGLPRRALPAQPRPSALQGGRRRRTWRRCSAGSASRLTTARCKPLALCRPLAEEAVPAWRRIMDVRALTNPTLHE